MTSREHEHSARSYIKSLNLQPHPEGGFFLETYRSSESISRRSLPDRFPGDRALSTSILYLLESGQFSRLHRIRVDETWHFYAGSPLALYLLESEEQCRTLRLGTDVAGGQIPQLTIPHGTWFGAAVMEEDSFSLVGCTTAPGFDFDDFELADFKTLVALFPRHEDTIRRLTP